MITGVTPERWRKIAALDIERQEIQDRIYLTSKRHHGTKLTPSENKMLDGHTAYLDAVRYCQIEDKQWALLGIKKPAGDDNFPG